MRARNEVECGDGGDAAEVRWRKRRSATAGEAALRRRRARRWLAAVGEVDMGRWRPRGDGGGEGLNRPGPTGRWGTRLVNGPVH
ncbi:Os02g0132150 [Oryza sativa Japonica Group]|uniref:Os02g0132150 protein n=1 Tax=Oryza sativa subsp. japonica TaxID=39947 RepID=A0A0P0VEL1_ORYSJ|nr:Os02g0132150 [Oryza sativa Japonica Group]